MSRLIRSTCAGVNKLPGSVFVNIWFISISLACAIVFGFAVSVDNGIGIVLGQVENHVFVPCFAAAALVSIFESVLPNALQVQTLHVQPMCLIAFWGALICRRGHYRRLQSSSSFRSRSCSI